jgi:hypothetical protein
LAQPTTTFLEEMMAAARGCFALLVGNRQAPSFFDFSQRGLVGSLIAFLVITTAMAFLGAAPLGMPGEATRAIIASAVVFVLKAGASWLLLRQNGRLDGFIPYLVADNWVSFFTAILAIGLMFITGASDIAVFGVGLLVIVIEINIARLIVTLTPWQIAIFIVVQMVASSVGLILLFAFGILTMPDVSAAAGAV